MQILVTKDSANKVVLNVADEDVALTYCAMGFAVQEMLGDGTLRDITPPQPPAEPPAEPPRAIVPLAEQLAEGLGLPQLETDPAAAETQARASEVEAPTKAAKAVKAVDRKAAPTPAPAPVKKAPAKAAAKAARKR